MNEQTIDNTLNALLATATKWRVDGEYVTPTREMVRETLDTLARSLYAGKQYGQAVTGGIVVMLNNGHLDVFTHTGEYNDDSN